MAVASITILPRGCRRPGVLADAAGSPRPYTRGARFATSDQARMCAGRFGFAYVCDCGDASGRRPRPEHALCALRPREPRWLVLRDPNHRASRATAVVCRRDAPVGDVQRAVSPGREAAWEVQAADHHNRVAAVRGDADDRASAGSRVVEAERRELGRVELVVLAKAAAGNRGQASRPLGELAAPRGKTPDNRRPRRVPATSQLADVERTVLTPRTWPFGETRSSVFEPASTTQRAPGRASTPYGFASGNWPGTRFV